MKTKIPVLLLLACLAASAQTNQSTPSSAIYSFRGVQFPRVEPDNRVTFRFNAPNAQKVRVSIVNVPFDMVKGENGDWTYTSEPQAPGYHNYWLIVDDAIVLDPNVETFVGYGHLCNGFEIPDPQGGFYE